MIIRKFVIILSLLFFSDILYSQDANAILKKVDQNNVLH